jgi:hypothetical protein
MTDLSVLNKYILEKGGVSYAIAVPTLQSCSPFRPSNPVLVARCTTVENLHKYCPRETGGKRLFAPQRPVDVFVFVKRISIIQS